MGSVYLVAIDVGGCSSYAFACMRAAVRAPTRVINQRDTNPQPENDISN